MLRYQVEAMLWNLIEIFMEVQTGNYHLTIFDEPDYRVGSADNRRNYDQLYEFDSVFRPSALYGIHCVDEQQNRKSCVLLAAAAGASRVHKHSAVVVQDRCFIAVSNQLCCLSLPDLYLHWSTTVDGGTCFGVYHSISQDCLITHGELEIARVDFEGRIVWSAGGKDIFTGTLRVEDKFVFVTDFNDELYRIEIATGNSELITP